MDRRLRRYLARLSFPPPPAARMVTEDDLSGLPDPAQRYLGFMEVLGKPVPWSFYATFSGRFKMDDSKPWVPASGCQYNAINPPTRVYLMRLRLGILPISGADTYVNGQGLMRARLFGLKTVLNDSSPELTVGELSTYLSELVCFMPSALFLHDVVWAERGGDSFDLTLKDHEHAVTGTVILDGRGAFKEFVTTDRFYARSAKEPLVRTRWSLEARGSLDGTDGKVAREWTAVWHPADGDVRYADFFLQDIAWNVSPW